MDMRKFEEKIEEKKEEKKKEEKKVVGYGQGMMVVLVADFLIRHLLY